MKNFFFFFILLLPVFGISQSTLAKWVYADYTATDVPTEITAYTISTSGVPTLSIGDYGATDTFYGTNPWPINTENEGSYIQFKIKAAANYTIKPTTFSFKARLTGGSANMKVKCSKNDAFDSGALIIVPLTPIVGSNYATYIGNFPSNYSSDSGGYIYIRIYVYSYDTFHIQYDLGNIGPTIKGTIASSNPAAVNDNLSVSKNISTNLNVLQNDFSGTGTIASIGSLSTPTNGATVSVNPDKTIKFTPATNFLGTSTFNYTITGSQGGSTNSSTATVTVNVVESALVEWDLNSNASVSASQSYVTGTSVLFGGTSSSFSSTGLNIGQFNNVDFAHYRYFDIKVKPKTGKTVKVSDLVFNQARLTAGTLTGASHYQIKYKVVTGAFAEDEYSFYNSANVLVNEGLIADNPIVDKTVNVTLSDMQTLVIRIYGRNSNDYNYKGWNIKANSLKLRGYEVIPCVLSTAPSSISGGNTTVCPNTSVTLTANGGLLGTDAIYQWGKGAVSNANMIAGQNAASIVIAQSEANATYWVRRKDSAACGGAETNAVTTTLTTSVPGNPTVYGTDKWIGYVYTYLGTMGITPSTDNYIGFVTENNTIFDRNNVGNSPGGDTVNLCSSPQDKFWIRYRRTINFDMGSYSFTIGSDDGARLSLDGGTTWIINNWGDHGYSLATSNLYCLSGTYDVVLEYYENTGLSQVSFNYSSTTSSPTAPSSILGPDNVCAAGESITLTAVGSNMGDGGYRWGTGTMGSNIIVGQNNSTINVSPSIETVYWVQASTCSGNTTGVTKVVTVGTLGNPTDFGQNIWNVYVFNQTSFTPSTVNYRGFYTQNTIGLDTQDIANNGWNINESPSSSAGWSGCSVPNDNFTFIHKREGFPAGSYRLNVRNYDDATQIFLDNVLIKSYAGWYGGNSSYSDIIGVYCLNSNSKIEVRTIENGGGATVKIDFELVEAIYSGGSWVSDIDPSNLSINIQDNISISSNLKVCSCTVKSGMTLTVPSDKTLTVLENIVVEEGGKIIVSNNGSFVQVNDNTTYTGLPTSFVSKRTTQPVTRYDFTYWSSPVENFILKSVSPNTLFDKFFSWNSTAQNWTEHPSNLLANLEIMAPGKGYTVRAPQSFSTTAYATHTAEFIGKPNNGVKQIAVSNNAENRWNLIGNPYPSAIKLEQFLLTNENVVDGTLYFWTHKSPIVQNGNSSYYTYSTTDYVTANLSGNVSNDKTNDAGLEVAKDFQNIASGQSFFIKGKETGAIGNQVTFNNAMRVQTGGSNGAFFKPGITTPVDNWETTGKHRMWLNITTTQNDFNQALVGYIENATNDLDWGYDGEVFSSGAVTLYSLSNEKDLTIQARALPFSNQDQVPLGYKTTRTGTLTISIDHVDGLFEGQAIYLQDNVLNIVHDLKDSDYSFTTVPGTFENRFVLRYVPQETLGTETPTLDANSIVVFNTNNQISIKSANETIAQVVIYDLQGRTLFTKSNVNAQEFATQSLSASNQVVVVKVITENKAELVKKVILK